MIARILISLFACCSVLLAKPSIDPNSVVILYNTNSEESSKLATYYAQQRGIPEENIIGLATSKEGHISRAEYITTIQDPLRRKFSANGWWQLGTSSDGFILPVRNSKRLLVTMYGVPFGIKNDAIPKASSDKMHLTQRPNNAAVDSELAVFGIQDAPIQGPLENRYFRKDASFSTIEALTPYFLVGRIDGPDFATAKRLIDDAIATEKQGLWGMCYLDKAFKGNAYQIGDDWLTNIEKNNWQKGIPTTLESTPQTYLTNYPMRDAALYFGWYTGSFNGPLLDPDFHFKRGAVAVHLHSFSASNLRDAQKNWTGPILAKGAAATVGNVYEPYLQMTHYFDILHQRLLAGYTFIESASMAIPVLSWQNVAIGDPLYQPYKHLDGSGIAADEDKLYRAVNLAFRAWKGDDATITQKLKTAAIQQSDARYYEILGLWSLSQGKKQKAIGHLYAALNKFATSSDKVRIALHLAYVFREEKNKDLAVSTLKDALVGRENTAEGKSLKAMLNILLPPPPPPAEPRKNAKR